MDIESYRAAWELEHTTDYFKNGGDFVASLRKCYVTDQSDAGLMAATWRYIAGDQIKYTSEKHVFEIGCGCGMIGARVAPSVKRYIGVDIAENTIRPTQAAIEPAGLPPTFEVHHVPDCDFSRWYGWADIVYTTAVLIHTPPEMTKLLLCENAKLLRAGGRFSHNFNIVRGGTPEDRQPMTVSYSEQSLRELFKDTGLVIKHMDDWKEYKPGAFPRIVSGGLSDAE